jgi:hypothetical protein
LSLEEKEGPRIARITRIIRIECITRIHLIKSKVVRMIAQNNDEAMKRGRDEVTKRLREDEIQMHPLGLSALSLSLFLN